MAVLLLAFPSAATATFPGANGKIAFEALENFTPQTGWQKIDIFSVNPDGSGRVQLTANSEKNFAPAWSPDGTKIAFTSTRTNPPMQCRDCPGDIYVMNADGTAQTRITATGLDNHPAWSPDGQRIAFSSGRDGVAVNIWVMNADGTAPVRITDTTYSDHPSWSPDGTKIAFTRYSGGGETDIATANPDGSGQIRIGGNGFAAFPSWAPDATKIVYGDLFFDDGQCPYAVVSCPLLYMATRNGSPAGVVRGVTDQGSPVDSMPAWSPDGTRIAFLAGNSRIDGFEGLSTIRPSGADIQLVIADEPHVGEQLRNPDWQPILKGYPRPKGAGTEHFPLIPAYQPCSSPNRQHAAPLSLASCNPPTQSSTQLTVGTPDANAKPANSVASLRIGVIPGLAGPPDDAEVNLITSITDVRNASDLTDYTGNLEMRVPLRITDKSNTPYPGGPGPGTAADFTFTWNVPCTATSDPNIGSSCNLSTTGDTLLPGSALEGRRAIWQTDQIEVRDGAGQPFLRQGVFVP